MDIDDGSCESAAPGCGSAAVEPFPQKQRQRVLARLGVDRWHTIGFRGQNVRVAVLDSGFRGYRAQLGKALPARVTTRSFRTDGNLEAKDSQHGILCAEVVHALAPEAELLLANWQPDSPESFIKAVSWARQQGAKVISCSVIMPSWSDGEGGGRLNHELAEILGPGNKSGDLLFFASAGNTAQRHWSGQYRAGSDGWHQWEPGLRTNTLTPWGEDRVAVELYGTSGGVYEVIVESQVTGEVVGRATGRDKKDLTQTVVRFQPTENRSYEVRARLVKGQPGDFHVVALGGNLSCASARGSIPFPADGPAVAVGAVGGDGHRAFYSSCGPNSRQPKPDLAASVPFPSLWRDTPFTGTSAAAPQAAALAALWFSRHQDWPAERVRNAMQSFARDIHLPGHDWETGYGLISLPKETIRAASPDPK